MDSLRILLLGDEQVGKTSIIRCYLTQSFPSEVPPCNPVVSIPADISANRCSLKIFDTYFRKEQDQDFIQKELQKASIVLLVFDVTRPETLKRVSSFWLPLIEKTCRVPVILLGNKNDLPKHSKDLEDIGKEIRLNFPFCQIMAEITAKSFISISKIFEIAEHAVRYPIEALYNPMTFELTQEYVRALKFIFRICDKDGDLRLNNEEMNEFNRSVFGVDLSPRELEKIKLIVKENTNDGIDHVGITLQGFITLHKFFITKLKSENSWKILSYFKFNEKLERNIEVIIRQSDDSTVELSYEAIEFLGKVFRRYSSHGLLTESGVSEICSTLSQFPWEIEYFQLVPTVEKSLTVYSWISIWHLMMNKDSAHAVKSLLSIGFPSSYERAYKILKKSDFSNRRVHVCQIFGHTRVGKKLLIKKFLNLDAKKKVNNTVCGTIEELEDISSSSFIILSKENISVKPDVVCLVYDGSSASINHIKKLVIDENMPRILMLNKNDNIDHESAYSFALELGLKECPQFNLKIQRPSTLFKQLKDYAINPLRVPFRRVKVKNKPKKQRSYLKWILTVGLLAVSLVAVGKSRIKIG